MATRDGDNESAVCDSRMLCIAVNRLADANRRPAMVCGLEPRTLDLCDDDGCLFTGGSAPHFRSALGSPNVTFQADRRSLEHSVSQVKQPSMPEQTITLPQEPEDKLRGAAELLSVMLQRQPTPMQRHVTWSAKAS